MISPSPTLRADRDTDRLTALEERIARLEARLGSDSAEVTTPMPAAVPMLAPVANGEAEDELEFEVGQNWFAIAGVIALTAGTAFMLSLPYPNLPAWAPGLAGYGFAAVAGLLAHLWRRTFAVIAGYLRGVAIALLCLAALRLCHPVAHAVFDPEGVFGRGLLLATAGANVALALRRQSPWLLGLALATGAALLLATRSAVLLPAGLVVLAVVAAGAGPRWPWLPVAAMPMIHGAYLAWAAGNPFVADKLTWATPTPFAPVLLLIATEVLALPAFRSAHPVEEAVSTKVGALVNCALGYLTFLVTTYAGFKSEFAALQFGASIVFLALAAASAWRGAHVANFLFAMTGYGALTMALIRLSDAPAVFIWLSVQSVVVVATAVWFRSRLIVVGNFVIYLVIVLGYVVLAASHENGISIGLGLVALVSARILAWQKDRLALQTEFMRNAYLVAGFVVFPYALAHLVPPRLVAVAWIVLAGVYYGLNGIVRSRKYRWMGHGTLVLASVYVIAAGTRRADPVYRTLSFLLLGAVLLGVSLAFTRSRRRSQAHSNLPGEQP